MGVTICLSEPHKGWCSLSLTSACYTEQVMAGLPSQLGMSSRLFPQHRLCIRSLMHQPGPAESLFLGAHSQEGPEKSAMGGGG